MSALSLNSPFYCAHCITCRLPVLHCVCARIQHSDLPFAINICSHSNEWQKMDNTGHWAFLSSPTINRIKWHRKAELIDWGGLTKPSKSVKNGEKRNTEYLLFPSVDAQDIKQLNTPIERLWVIDGTWQEAQKMLRQSPWMQDLPHIKITLAADSKSEFILRRNQQGLSTLEAIAAALTQYSGSGADCANTLNDNFKLFQNALLGLKK